MPAKAKADPEVMAALTSTLPQSRSNHGRPCAGAHPIPGNPGIAL